MSQMSLLSTDDVEAVGGEPARAARLFADFVATSAAEVPLPGVDTPRRLEALAALGRRDLSLARLAEGHLDAVAVLHEIEGTRPTAAQRWGVWAARPPQPVVRATPTAQGWTLDGVKPFCSGARVCTHALVTAEADDGYRLFAVALDQNGVRAVEGTWPALGMAGSDSLDVSFDQAVARPVGDPEDYLRRPGFQHGGIGVAACWLGGAHAVADTLYRRASEGRLNEHAAAHLGAVDIALHAADTVLRQAAADIDADPHDRARQAALRSMRVRAVAAQTCADVLDRVGRATGAGPLCRDEEHARTAADLTVYVRQHHAEGDLAALGHALGDRATEGHTR
ncbi:acyl-CoA dehydrogenase family protein [Streptomyces sp. HUAS MG91]|uniref:Acyl-CoA dehydrogenase family protein n=1 Tax=Streptomyces tabacisoli TaxID=3156398 RepID=A0AAU8ILQ1_9ACTN